MTYSILMLNLFRNFMNINMILKSFTRISKREAIKFAVSVTYIAIARMENYYEGSQERNTVATGDWQYAKAQRCHGGKEPCIIDDSVLMLLVHLSFFTMQAASLAARLAS